jgi:hypothetical protein
MLNKARSVMIEWRRQFRGIQNIKIRSNDVFHNRDPPAEDVIGRERRKTGTSSSSSAPSFSERRPRVDRALLAGLMRFLQRIGRAIFRSPEFRREIFDAST